eukprot:CAMPEP_0177661076 /NCGR_PEP_ID=MMETSP0447-20121125/18445_1 /TAXON_ID=0 /ORGANISM="Stygamoeba regulata, Strain BSH-02190019" /LENGTH=237 /DNA_ID=CAMNT_0019166313 /DNA_START=21 /DNA_END=734 /DNA_ORIENTATION=+
MRFAIFLAAIVLLAASVEAKPAPSKDNSWDFMLLSLLWPEQECRHIKPCIVPESVNYFTIHGLWPERADMTYPEHCPGEGFDHSALDGLRDQLNAWWPDFKSPGSNDFYQHEWSTHGTCATGKSIEGMRTQTEYFTLALSLRERLNTTDVLAAAGIKPSHEQSYTLEAIQKAISKTYGFYPLLYCSTEKGGKTAIWQIKYCVGADLDFMDCPANELQRAIDHGGCNIEAIYLMPKEN